jgi:hypothetical protein
MNDRLDVDALKRFGCGHWFDAREQPLCDIRLSASAWTFTA